MDTLLPFESAGGLAREEIHQVGIFPPEEVTEALIPRPKERLSQLVIVSEKGRETCVLARTRASGYPHGVYSFCPPVSTEFLKEPCGIPAEALPFLGRELEGCYVEGLNCNAHSKS